MTLHQPRPPTDNPFLAWQLEGWEPDGEKTSFPISFAVHTEGENIGLYLSPVDLFALQEALELPDEDKALVFRGSRRFTVPWAMVGLLGPDVDVVHLPYDRPIPQDDLPMPLLVDPARAIPEGSGSRVAISLHDDCHGAIISRDAELLARCLRGFLGDYQATVIGRPVALPALSDELMTDLLIPRPPGAYTRVALRPSRRYWSMELQHALGDGLLYEERWVSEGEGGRWRSGWAW